MRFCVLLFPLSFISLPAHGSTIKNFVIVNSGTLGLSGGQFSNGDTYSGTFSLDTSNLNKTPLGSPNTYVTQLTSYDITLTGTNATHFSSNNPTTQDVFGIAESSTTPISVGSTSVYPFQFFFQGYSSSGAITDLLLQLLEPLDAFKGGLVIAAAEGSANAVYDYSSSAMIVDPAVLSAVAPTPLPPAMPLFVTGLCALGLLGWRRQRKAAALAA